MKKDPEGQSKKQHSNVVVLRARVGPVQAHGSLPSPGIEGHREPTGEDVIAILLGCAPAGLLRDLGLTRASSAEWASLIESNRTALERLQATGGSSSSVDRAEAVRQRSNYSAMAGLALVYAFRKRAWVFANPRARETIWQAAVPLDVLMQFGESVRCDAEEEAGALEDASRAVIGGLREKVDALRAAEAERARNVSGVQKKKADKRWAGAAKAKYLSQMLDWRRANPSATKKACADHFHPLIQEEYRDDAPDWDSVRAWLKGK
ncbi:hypothetical protein [Ramlibacter sp.]|uniref:hypothetical protein n=1 Tax=Ramlibacter sp. TaxID=1917967 RepID=UPI0026345908|nr:hypothetical protein [Ramlibacter sp.]MDB5957526.1 hypothetical protein [Ramlibacter sp.]